MISTLLFSNYFNKISQPYKLTCKTLIASRPSNFLITYKFNDFVVLSKNPQNKFHNFYAKNKY